MLVLTGPTLPLLRACRSPIIAIADPTSPTAANILLNPPTTGGPVTSYEVKLCPAPPASGACVSRSCPTISCPVTGLTPGASYIVSAEAIVGGTRVPASNTLLLVMPENNTPTLISATATGSTTGAATAAAPPGVTYTQVGGRGYATGSLLCNCPTGIHDCACALWCSRCTCVLSAVQVHRHTPEWRQASHCCQRNSGCYVYRPHPRHPGGCLEVVLAARLWLPASQHACQCICSGPGNLMLLHCCCCSTRYP